MTESPIPLTQDPLSLLDICWRWILCYNLCKSKSIKIILRRGIIHKNNWHLMTKMFSSEPKYKNKAFIPLRLIYSPFSTYHFRPTTIAAARSVKAGTIHALLFGEWIQFPAICDCNLTFEGGHTGERPTWTALALVIRISYKVAYGGRIIWIKVCLWNLYRAYRNFSSMKSIIYNLTWDVTLKNFAIFFAPHFPAFFISLFFIFWRCMF